MSQTPFQPGAVLNTQAFGNRPEGLEVPHIDVRAPTANDIRFEVGKQWNDIVNKNLYFLMGLSSFNGATTATWALVSSSSGAIVSVLGTANQITSTVAGDIATLSIPTTFIAPGTIAATTTVTATLGNITATNGNFVSSAAGKGIVLNSGTASGTTTATLNGRSGQVTITTPSIAAGAQFTFTLTNSSVTASTTQVLYGLTGGDNGSAVTIQSVTNSANTSVVVLNNGSGDTATSTLSFVLTFLVLN